MVTQPQITVVTELGMWKKSLSFTLRRKTSIGRRPVRSERHYKIV